jgi:single-strand DNA-binding protein
MVNKQLILGRVGSDIKKVDMKEGRSLVTFSVATADNFKDKEGKWVDRTEWHYINSYISAFNESMVKLLEKGDMVYIEGKTETQEFKSKEGETVRRKVVMLSSFKKLYTTASKNGEHKFKDGIREPKVPEAPAFLDSEEDDTDLPF